MRFLKFSFIFLLILNLLGFLFINSVYASEGTVIRATSDFKKIDIEGPFILTIDKSSNSNLEIKGEMSLIPFVITTIESDTLFIRLTSDTPVPAGQNLKLKIFPKNFNSLKAGGFAKIYLNDIKAENFELKLTDSTQTYISGIFNKFILIASGKSKIYTQNLKISGRRNLLNLVLNGGVELKLTKVFIESLKADLNGLSSLEVSGSVKNLYLNAKGSGTLQAKNLKVKNALIQMDDCSEADINVSSKLKVFLKGSSTLNYRGTPKLKKKLSNTAKIRKI